MARRSAGKKAVSKPNTEFEKPTAVHATPLEVAQFFNISKWAVYRAIHADPPKIEAVEVFGQYRIPWRVVFEMSPNTFTG